MPTYSPLISAEALLKDLRNDAGKGALTVVDCRFELARPGWGRQAFSAGRIAQAVYLDVESDLSSAPDGSNGRHPLPDPGLLAQALGRAGIGSDSHVVAYDQGSMMMAARLWWLLRWLGHSKVRVLNGGIAAWNAAGQPLESDAPRQPVPRQFTPHVQAQMLATAAEIETEIQARPGGGQLVLLDARAAERYRGEVEPVDAVAGHVPGALNRPFSSNFKEGLFKSWAELHSEFVSLLGGAAPTQVVHSCGSGLSAAVNVLAMEEAGLSGSRLYAGGWSEWSSDPQRPVKKCVP